jgi:hypothetical protein
VPVVELSNTVYKTEAGALCLLPQSSPQVCVVVDWEVAIVKGYPIQGGFAIAFFLCIFA